MLTGGLLRSSYDDRSRGSENKTSLIYRSMPEPPTASSIREKINYDDDDEYHNQSSVVPRLAGAKKAATSIKSNVLSENLKRFEENDEEEKSEDDDVQKKLGKLGHEMIQKLLKRHEKLTLEDDLFSLL